eukprot:11210043-Alexandrium_andersonii.AAC.1
MSASLVGSEMCIRDRCVVAQILGADVRGGAASAALRARRRRPKSTTGRAVSYTHLTLPTICSV